MLPRILSRRSAEKEPEISCCVSQRCEPGPSGTTAIDTRDVEGSRNENKCPKIIRKGSKIMKNVGGFGAGIIWFCGKFTVDACKGIVGIPLSLICVGVSSAFMKVKECCCGG